MPVAGFPVSVMVAGDTDSLVGGSPVSWGAFPHGLAVDAVLQAAAPLPTTFGRRPYGSLPTP